MDTEIKRYHLVAALIVFVVLPVGLYALGDFPRRSELKEFLSISTLLAFAVMLSQFFLARSDQYFVKPFKFSRVLSVHKFMGYLAVGFFLLHPFFIVLPRFFEAGVSPGDALIQMLTTFESLGVILGLVSWGLMIVLGATSLFRDRLNMPYATWKVFHGLLSILFIAVAAWHAIELGRHADRLISLFIIVLAITGSSLVVKKYIVPSKTVLGVK
jgi:predicted ferric reductase